MLAFTLLLRQVIPRLCRRNLVGTWSFSEGNSPLKSATGEIILDGAKQKERFVDYYFELYDRENLVPEEALNVIKCLPVLEELDIEPTEEEVKEALGSPSSG